MDLGISGRRAVVGGASSGLGRAVAERLAAEGCDLLLWSRGVAALEATAADIRDRFRVAVWTQRADAADPASAERVAERALETLGAVDIAFLNAGGPVPSDPAATEPAEWGRSFQLLATTPIDLATRLLPGMRERHWGRIVANLSYVVRQPEPALSYSTAGRAALIAWLKTLSRAVAADGVTVNGVLPGRFETPRMAILERAAAERTGRSVEEVHADDVATTPARRFGRPEELASYVAYLCSDLAGFQTGTFTQIDGGLIEGLP